MIAELITRLRHSSQARELLSGICPQLSLAGNVARELAAVEPIAQPERARTGIATLQGGGPRDVFERLVEGAARLRDVGLPATFIYLFDETWGVGERVRTQASALIGHPYRIAADVWAWHIEPGKGRGWAPHRGLAKPVFDRAAPELLNTWVALSDVEIDRACMHFIPLDEDPAYPGQLASIDVPDGKAIAAPLAAGDALMWNANTLHWGGECAETARGPRVSCSFSLVRADAVERVGIPLADPLPRTLEERLDLIARQIVVYGEGQPDVRPEVLEWARASVFLAMYRPVTQRKAP